MHPFVYGGTGACGPLVGFPPYPPSPPSLSPSRRHAASCLRPLPLPIAWRPGGRKQGGPLCCLGASPPDEAPGTEAGPAGPRRQRPAWKGRGRGGGGFPRREHRGWRLACLRPTPPPRVACSFPRAMRLVSVQREWRPLLEVHALKGGMPVGGGGGLRDSLGPWDVAHGVRGSSVSPLGIGWCGWTWGGHVVLGVRTETFLALFKVYGPRGEGCPGGPAAIQCARNSLSRAISYSPHPLTRVLRALPPRKEGGLRQSRPPRAPWACKKSERAGEPCSVLTPMWLPALMSKLVSIGSQLVRPCRRCKISLFSSARPARPGAGLHDHACSWSRARGVPTSLGSAAARACVRARVHTGSRYYQVVQHGIRPAPTVSIWISFHIYLYILIGLCTCAERVHARRATWMLSRLQTSREPAVKI